MSRTGSATRVAAGALAPVPSPSRPLTPEPTGPAPSPRLSVDFCPGVPDLTSFPRADWARAMRDSCRNATPSELGYGDPRGTETLREVLAGYLRRVRGTVADAERIVICVGFGQGINLVLRSLAGDGDPAGGDRGPGRRRLPRDLRPPRDRGGSRPDRRARDRRRRARRDRRPSGDPHPHPSVPDRHRAGSRAPPGAGRVGGRARRDDHRGRLRRRVPLRPRPDRRAPGTGSRTGRADRHGQQVARPGAPARVGRLPGAAARGGGRGQAAERPRVADARAAGAGDADRVRSLRPSPAPHARRLRARVATRWSTRSPSRRPTSGCRGWRRASMRSLASGPRPTSRRSSRRRAPARSGCTA